MFTGCPDLLNLPAGHSKAVTHSEKAVGHLLAPCKLLAADAQPKPTLGDRGTLSWLQDTSLPPTARLRTCPMLCPLQQPAAAAAATLAHHRLAPTATMRLCALLLDLHGTPGYYSTHSSMKLHSTDLSPRVSLCSRSCAGLSPAQASPWRAIHSLSLWGSCWLILTP